MAAKLPSALACHDSSTALEFPREEILNCLGESGRQLITSFAPQTPQEDNPNFSSISRIATDEEEMDVIKAKMLGHPEFRCLLEAYIHCITVGGTPEIVTCLDAAIKDFDNRQNEMIMNIGMDPELDMFMETYCEMLSTLREKLAKPFMETMSFFKKIEAQLSSLNNETISTTHSAESDERTEGGGSMDEEDSITGEKDYQWADQHSEERELKDLLLRKYGGYLGRLRQRFMKKKKGGKLPKEARQKLLHWWDLHQKWPYPSDTEKMALAEYTRLDPKQINNWFINQRKRHWKFDSEDTEFELMGTHRTRTAEIFLE
ncbi:hypothetical protein SUGI_0538020 [Cryptomeria japonica]|nr:hypothetical protein SUGI_0538020 [Cryptomeria japonica]